MQSISVLVNAANSLMTSVLLFHESLSKSKLSKCVFKIELIYRTAMNFLMSTYFIYLTHGFPLISNPNCNLDIFIDD